MVRELNPEILNEGDLSRRIKDVAVFAQGIPNGVRVLDDGRLIVVPGDRHEVVMAACLAAQNGTRLAALLLSAGIRPDPQIWQLTRAAFTGLPVLLVELDSYQTTTRVRDLDPRLPPDDVDRVEGVTNNVADALNASWLQSLAGSARPHRLTPAGAVHITAATVRPALQILGTKPGSRLVSSIFFMCLPDEVVIYGDCAINPQPDAEDLADIAISSAASARAFGIEPRVAMISFSTGTSAVGMDVDKVAEATRIVREREPGLAVDGPLQYDAAAIASVGQAKRPGSPVAGRASVFIFPDLDTGNTTYKAVQRSAQVVSIGPMLQGLAKPVNDLSRGALVEDIIYTVALTAIQARAS